MAQVIHPPGIIPAGEPFSPASVSGGLVYCSGQIGIDSNGNINPDLKAQVKQACDNLATLLKAAGTDTSKVFKNTIYLTDFAHLEAINEVLARYFKPPYAASTCVKVSGLFGGALFEIEVIAER